MHTITGGLLIGVLLVAPVLAAGPEAAHTNQIIIDNAARQPVTTAPAETPDQYNARMKWWREARFGMFITWGTVSLLGDAPYWSEVGWARDGARPGLESMNLPKGTIAPEVYDNLYKRFNPVKFNANDWVRLARDAGAKYIVFVTKHTDGFCFFDSKYTDYKITSAQCPFGRDVLAELAAACHKVDMPLGIYYSQMSWPHPDYKNERHARYIEFMHNQLRELCTNYGKVSIFWFDGPGPTSDWKAEEAIAMVRRLQPGIIINNRLALPEDFDTPEGYVGAFQRNRPWESCMTINDQWSWRNLPPRDERTLIQKLIQCAGGDGNLLLDVGPRADGTIDPRQVERMQQIGHWLERYGESIYATRGGPFRPDPTRVSTCRGNRIYIHVLDSKTGNLVLPPLPKRILASELLTGGNVVVDQTDKTLRISIPHEHRRDIDTIVALEIDGDAETIAPSSLPSGSLAFGKTAASSGVLSGAPHYAAAMAFDDDPVTRWAAPVEQREGWLAVDLGSPQTIGRATIREAYNFTRKYELQRKVGEQWETFHTGTSIGEWAEIKFPPVTAQHIRLHVTEATSGPSIMEFQLFPLSATSQE